MARSLVSVMIALAVLLGAGCATSFSPARIRSEIARQTGADPQRMVEVNVGRATMALARRVIGPSSEGFLPAAGLKHLELAVYDLPATGGGVDFTRMAVRGWEPTVRVSTPKGSTLVLIRGSSDALEDVVLVTCDADQALYARLSGRLSTELPAALGAAAARSGPEAVGRDLMSLAPAAD